MNTTQSEAPLERASNIYSWLLCPVLLPTYGAILIFTLSVLRFLPAGVCARFILVVFGLTAVLPMTLIYIMKLFGIVHDVALNDRRERKLPYAIMALCLAATAWFMASRKSPDWVWAFYAGGALAGTVNLIVNNWWKISAHAAAAAGVVAMLVRVNAVGLPPYNLVWWIAGAIVLTGLLGTVRIYLRRHTFGQVMAGYAVGFAAVFFFPTF